MAGFKVGSGTFRMNVALSELPDFTCLPGRRWPSITRSGIIIAPDARLHGPGLPGRAQYGWSQAPIVEMLIPRTVDDSLAPPGAHVASLFCQQFAPVLPDGRSWDDEREAAADLIIDTVDACAPDFKASVLGRMILSPLDLERTLRPGRRRHLPRRPDAWTSSGRRGRSWATATTAAPLKGLYMCGAGTHPGGGVTGAPGPQRRARNPGGSGPPGAGLMQSGSGRQAPAAMPVPVPVERGGAQVPAPERQWPREWRVRHQRRELSRARQ